MLLMMFVVWIVAGVAMYGLSGSLDRQYRKEQEKHPKTKPGLREKIPSWIIVIVVIVGGYFVLVRGLGLIVDRYNLETKKQEEKVEQIEADYKSLHEANIDEPTGKRILTEKFLEKEYELFYFDTETNDSRLLHAGIVVLFVIIAFGLFSAAQFFVGSLFKKYRSTVRAVIYLLIPIAFLAAGIYALQWAYSRKLPPSPDQVEKIEVYKVTASKSKTTHETEDGTDTDYYVHIDFGDGKGEVTYTEKDLYHLYLTIDEKGTYYLLRAKANGKDYDVMCFPEGKFISEEEAGNRVQVDE